VLEIDRTATTEEIKSLYRRLARVHPDKNLQLTPFGATPQARGEETRIRPRDHKEDQIMYSASAELIRLCSGGGQG
jgi:hypothetical protein